MKFWLSISLRILLSFLLFAVQNAQAQQTELTCEQLTKLQKKLEQKLEMVFGTDEDFGDWYVKLKTEINDSDQKIITENPMDPESQQTANVAAKKIIDKKLNALNRELKKDYSARLVNINAINKGILNVVIAIYKKPCPVQNKPSTVAPAGTQGPSQNSAE